MEWQDEGFILGGRRHGETSLILEIMTRHHGRHLGLVRGGRSRRLQPLMQPGTSVVATWRARLDEHLGSFVVEATHLRAAEVMTMPTALHALNALTGLLRVLAEREPHEALFEQARDVLAALGGSLQRDAEALVRLEAAVLAESGYGLDLDACAATGRRDDLVFVSPRTGRAVSREAGAPYADRLLRLPPFLLGAAVSLPPSDIGEDHATDAEPIEYADLEAGFALTGHFLMRDVLEPRGLALSPARDAVIAAVRRAEAARLSEG